MTIEKKIRELLDSKITGYKIYKETGIAESVISRLRSGEREVSNLNVETAQKLIDFYKEEINNMTRIYKNEDNKLVLSYKGIEDSDYENITLDEFIEIVEKADAWNDIDAEIYESALEDVGLEYENYDDPDTMWDDYLEAVRG